MILTAAELQRRHLRRADYVSCDVRPYVDELALVGVAQARAAELRELPV